MTYNTLYFKFHWVNLFSQNSSLTMANSCICNLKSIDNSKMYWNNRNDEFWVFVAFVLNIIYLIIKVYTINFLIMVVFNNWLANFLHTYQSITSRHPGRRVREVSPEEGTSSWDLNNVGAKLAVCVGELSKQGNCLCKKPKAQESWPVKSLPIGRGGGWKVERQGCEGSQRGSKQYLVSQLYNYWLKKKKIT